MTTNLRPGPEISSLYAFGSAIYSFDKTCHFVPKSGTKHFVPVSCKRLQKFHTGLTSYRSEFVPVSCKYPLTLKLRCRTAYFCSRMGSWEAHPGFYFRHISLYPMLIPVPPREVECSRRKNKQMECILSKRRTQTTSLLLPKTLEGPVSIQLCNSLLELLLKRKYECYSKLCTVKSRLQTSKFSLTGVTDVCVQNSKFALTFFLDKFYLLAYTIINLSL